MRHIRSGFKFCDVERCSYGFKKMGFLRSENMKIRSKMGTGK